MITRKLDDLGRIVIPKEMRKILNILEGDNLAITLETNGVMVKKFATACDYCNNDEEVVRTNKAFLCCDCRDILKSKRGE